MRGFVAEIGKTKTEVEMNWVENGGEAGKDGFNEIETALEMKRNESLTNV